MAIKQLLVDDIDGSEDATTINFSLESNTYAIDLSEANRKKLEEALAPFISKARKKGQKPRIKTVGKARPVTRPSSPTDLNAIRDWATSKGIKVSDRGRVPKDIVDQFNAEHNGSLEPAFSN